MNVRALRFNRVGRAIVRGGGGGRPGRGTGPQRGADLQSELHLSFEDSVSGVTTAVHLTSEAACSRCSGNGAEPGTTPLVCTNCGGRGVLDDNQGFFSFSQPCPTCQGRGTIVETPCTNCRGSGIEHRPREVKVRVPAGVQDGQRIRLKGRGGPGRNGLSQMKEQQQQGGPGSGQSRWRSATSSTCVMLATTPSGRASALRPVTQRAAGQMSWPSAQVASASWWPRPPG